MRGPHPMNADASSSENNWQAPDHPRHHPHPPHGLLGPRRHPHHPHMGGPDGPRPFPASPEVRDARLKLHDAVETMKVDCAGDIATFCPAPMDLPFFSGSTVDLMIYAEPAVVMNANDAIGDDQMLLGSFVPRDSQDAQELLPGSFLPRKPDDEDEVLLGSFVPRKPEDEKAILGSFVPRKPEGEKVLGSFLPRKPEAEKELPASFVPRKPEDEKAILGSFLPRKPEDVKELPASFVPRKPEGEKEEVIGSFVPRKPEDEKELPASFLPRKPEGEKVLGSFLPRKPEDEKELPASFVPRKPEDEKEEVVGSFVPRKPEDEEEEKEGEKENVKTAALFKKAMSAAEVARVEEENGGNRRKLHMHHGHGKRGEREGRREREGKGKRPHGMKHHKGEREEEEKDKKWKAKKGFKFDPEDSSASESDSSDGERETVKDNVKPIVAGALSSLPSLGNQQPAIDPMMTVNNADPMTNNVDPFFMNADPEFMVQEPFFGGNVDQMMVGEGQVYEPLPEPWLYGDNAAFAPGYDPGFMPPFDPMPSRCPMKDPTVQCMIAQQPAVSPMCQASITNVLKAADKLKQVEIENNDFDGMDHNGPCPVLLIGSIILIPLLLYRIHRKRQGLKKAHKFWKAIHNNPSLRSAVEAEAGESLPTPPKFMPGEICASVVLLLAKVFGFFIAAVLLASMVGTLVHFILGDDDFDDSNSSSSSDWDGPPIPPVSVRAAGLVALLWLFVGGAIITARHFSRAQERERESERERGLPSPAASAPLRSAVAGTVLGWLPSHSVPAGYQPVPQAPETGSYVPPSVPSQTNTV